MSSILSTLFTAANTLDAYTKVLDVTQNNVANASTPGFAKQSLPLEATQMDLEGGTSGGVTTGQMQSSRNEFAEQAVRTQQTTLGFQQQAVTNLTSLQTVFDISGNSGIDKALNDFYQSASAWGQTPTDATARQSVINSATEVAQSFQDAASSIQKLAQQTDSQSQSTVNQVNQIVGEIQTYNQTAMNTGTSNQDPGVDAQVHAALESLSQLVNFTATTQPDGTTTILLNGTTPLLVADQQSMLEASTTGGGANATIPNAPGSEQLLVDGVDVTSQSTGGQLGAILDFRNRVLASYIGDSTQAGDLNTMAQQFADRVNQLLTSGNSSDGPPPVPGVPLFTYDTTNPTNVAASLAVDPSVTPGQLAAISPGPPEVANGVPLALSQLANPTDPADEINGFSFSQYYGNLAANVGTQLQDAQDNVNVDQSLLSQAQNQRQQLSGVDLNEQAMMLVEFQRAYQANAQFITVLDQLTLDTINILGTVS
ncbi:MAG TPA: flagellar hook-associated protein FlgK [Bryobacteraceae bacterium]|nr:flagellar hook-associated protein FlgK [Bryobacteraceae bacterium]